MVNQKYIPHKSVIQHTILITFLIVAHLVTVTACHVTTPTPDPVIGLLNLASDLQEEGRYTAAEAAYGEALGATTSDDLVRVQLAELYLLWDRPRDGLDALTHVSPNAMTEETKVLHLQLLVADHQWQQVIALANDLTGTPNGASYPWQALIQAHLMVGDCDAARQTAKRAFQKVSEPQTLIRDTAQILDGEWALPPVSPDSLLVGIVPCDTEEVDCDRIVGLRLVRSAAWGLASCVLQQTTAIDAEAGELGRPKNHQSELLSWLGEALARTGQRSRASAAWHRATELSPESPLPWLLLGQERLVAGDLETARPALLHAQRLDPANPAPCLAMAELKALMGRYDEVNVWIGAALERAPREAEVWKTAARFYLARDLASESDVSRIIAQAHLLAPEDPEVHVLQGWQNLLSNEPAVALDNLETAIALDPARAEAHYLRALALEAVGDSDAAEDARIRAADLGDSRAQRR